MTANTTGFKGTAAKLRALATEGVERVARAALTAGLAVIRTAEQSAAPSEFKSAIGSRVLTITSSDARGKVGLGVGRGSRNRQLSRRALYYVVGTEARYRRKIGGKYAFIKRPTKAQLSTGTEPAHAFLSAARRSAMSAARKRMQRAATAAIKKELAQ